jgi:hypothetical protein
MVLNQFTTGDPVKAKTVVQKHGFDQGGYNNNTLPVLTLYLVGTAVLQLWKTLFFPSSVHT